MVPVTHEKAPSQSLALFYFHSKLAGDQENFVMFVPDVVDRLSRHGVAGVVGAIWKIAHIWQHKHNLNIK